MKRKIIRSISAISTFVVLSVAVTVPGVANAASIWTIERLSDTQANITMSGTIDEAVTSFSGLSFLGASATLGDTGIDIVLGDFAIGGVMPEGTYVQSGSTIFTIYFDDVGVAASSSATGTLQATLDAEIWSAIGTSGNVTNGFSGQGNVVGSYNIVGAITAVPLPAGLPLLLAGLGGLTGLRLRKMRKARV